MNLKPVTYREACKYINEHHRHHPAPQGHKFSIAAEMDGEIIGVVMAGRPVARHQDDGFTIEIIRLCTKGQKNVCSFLYAAAWRAAKAMGYRRAITYILETEPGISLKAAGWKEEAVIKGRSWSRGKRSRSDNHPLINKKRFEVAA